MKLKGHLIYLTISKYMNKLKWKKLRKKLRKKKNKDS